MSADGELHSGPVVSGPESGPETGPETPVPESGPVEEAPPVADEAPHGAQEGAQGPQEGAQGPQEAACDHYSNPGEGVCPKCGYDAAGA